MQDFLTEKLGARFVEPQTTDLTAMFKESSAVTPLIFVLSTGTDPAASLYKFAEKMKMIKRLFSISLGQGQGPRAEQMIEEGSEMGSWVFFQVTWSKKNLLNRGQSSSAILAFSFKWTLYKYTKDEVAPKTSVYFFQTSSSKLAQLPEFHKDF